MLVSAGGAVGRLAPAAKLVAWRGALEGADSRLALLLYVGLVLAAAPWLVHLVRRKGQRTSGLQLAAAVLVLLAGGTLFGLTRGHAADRAVQLPVTEPVRPLSLIRRAPRLPQLQHAAPVRDQNAPRVRVPHPRPNTPVMVTFDGVDVATVDELLDIQSAAHVQRLEEAIRMAQKGQPSDLVALEADRATPAAALAPVLATLHAGGYRRLVLLSERTARIKTAVLGTLSVPLEVGLVVTLPLPADITAGQHETYTSFARRLDALRRGRSGPAAP